MIEFPPVCLTLRPPWPQAIAYAGKRLENRNRGVASQLGTYRGFVGLSQSKWSAALDRAAGEIEFDLLTREVMKCPPSAIVRYERSGKLWLVAEVVDVLPPERCAADPWHVEGQHGIIMGKVYEVEPVPCVGGQGAWRPRWCFLCRTIVADSHGAWCKRCGTGLGSLAPNLNIVRECEP